MAVAWGLGCESDSWVCLGWICLYVLRGEFNGGGGCDGMAWDGIRRRLTNKAVA